MPGDKTSPGFWFSTARSLVFMAPIVMASILAISALVPVMFTVWGVVAFAAMTLIVWLVVVMGVMSASSLCSPDVVMEWLWDTRSAFHASMHVLVWSFIAMGVHTTAMASQDDPSVFYTLFFAMLALTSIFAAKFGRKQYYIKGVPNQNPEMDEGNWSQKSLRFIASSFMPRLTGDYSRFGFMPLLTIAYIILQFIVSGLLAVYSVSYQPTPEALTVAFTLSYLVPIMVWPIFAFLGRLWSDTHRYNPNVVDLSPRRG